MLALPAIASNAAPEQLHVIRANRHHTQRHYFFSNSGLNRLYSYSYRVRAADAAGNLSNFSNTSSATTQAAAIPHRQRHQPDSPLALRPVRKSASRGLLPPTTWCYGYRIERCTGASCTSFAQYRHHHRRHNFLPTPADRVHLVQLSRCAPLNAAGNLSNYSKYCANLTLSQSRIRRRPRHRPVWLHRVLQHASRPHRGLLLRHVGFRLSQSNAAPEQAARHSRNWHHHRRHYFLELRPDPASNLI